MDTTGAVTTSQKALDFVRATPIWILVAILLAIFSAWLSPALLGPLSDQIILWLPTAALFTLIVLLCRLGSELFARHEAKSKRSFIADEKRLKLIYRPIIVIFLTRHVTACTGIGAPYFRQRLRRALDQLKKYKSLIAGIKIAWQELFDRHISSSAEVEYGGHFPMTEITKIVQKHCTAADVKLINLVRRADRSCYEEFDTELMTKTQYELFEYIHSEHDRLSRKID